MTAAFLTHAAATLAPARILIASWFLLAVTQRWAAGRSPAAWGPGSDRAVHRLRALFLIQVAAAIAMAVIPSVAVLVACLLFLLATQGVLLLVTGVFWADGSEKMGMIAMAGTLFVALGVLAGDAALALAGALLAGGQLALCYATAGLSKLPFADWRDGRALTATMRSRSYGHSGVARALARHGWVAALASWAVIVAEAAFPLALFAPQPWLLAALGLLFAFHLATAVLMGLNTFPWAFAAAYPATLLLGGAARGLVA